MNPPPTMRYVAARQPGPPDVLEIATTETPKPKTGEVLIRVAYAGVNRPDCIQRAGTIRHRPTPRRCWVSRSPGDIVALGEGVDGWNMRRRRLRADARRRLRRVLHHAGGVVPAASQGTVARAGGRLAGELLHRLEQRVRPRASRAGETFLVHGGTSGIGLTAIQLAKAFGATVFTTAGSDEKAAFCRASAPTTRSTTRRRTSSPRCAASPASAAST